MKTFIFETFIPLVVVLLFILTSPLHIWWTWKMFDIGGMLWYMSLTENQHIARKRLYKWRYIREQKVE
jgi:hypothetical protein